MRIFLLIIMEAPGEPGPEDGPEWVDLKVELYVIMVTAAPLEILTV